MQGDDGLSGAGAALTTSTPRCGARMIAVLFGLDGPHDVVHPAGAGGVERGEQHLVGVGALVSGALGVGQVEEFVVERRDGASLRADVPAAAQSHRAMPGREIEGTGLLRTPVDDERRALSVVVADSDAADVVRRAVPEIKPPEAQPVLARVERAQQPGLLRDQHVSFQPGLETRAGLRQSRTHRALRLSPQVVEAGVETGDELLFLPEFLG